MEGGATRRNRMRKAIRVTKERKLIVKAVGIIKDWHCMNMDDKTAERMWDIYYNDAPEMKELREYIEQG